MSRGVRLAVVTAVAAGAVAGVAAGPVAAGTTHATTGGKPAKTKSAWQLISTTGATVPGSDVPWISHIGSDTYEAIWVHEYDHGQADQSYGIDARALDGKGTTAGIVDATDGWKEVYQDPVMGSGYEIAFDGYRGTTPSDPYGTEAEYDLGGGDGKTWTLGGSSLSPEFRGSAQLISTYQPVTVGEDGDRIGYYLGANNTPDPAPAWSGTLSTTGNYAVLPGVAESGPKTWVAWLSTSNTPSTEGVMVQQLQPSVGPRMRAPESLQPKGNTYGPEHQRLPLIATDPNGTAPYLAYAKWDASRVLVWRVGAKNPVASFKAADPSYITMARDTLGRLWVAWHDRNGYDFARSNLADNRFEVERHIGIGSDLPGAMGVASWLSTAVVVAFRAVYQQPGKTGIYLTEVHPLLGCSASPQQVAPGKKATFTVTDVGDPVKDALVTLGGKHGKTAANGKVKLHVPSAPGAYPASVTLDTYVGCHAKIRVVKPKS